MTCRHRPLLLRALINQDMYLGSILLVYCSSRSSGTLISTSSAGSTRASGEEGECRGGRAIRRVSVAESASRSASNCVWLFASGNTAGAPDAAWC